MVNKSAEWRKRVNENQSIRLQARKIDAKASSEGRLITVGSYHAGIKSRPAEYPECGEAK